MKVALVYDRVNKWGGAERVLLALYKLFPDAALFTSVYNPSKAPWANVFTIYPSFLQKVPFASSKHEFVPFLMPLAFEQFNFDEYDLVISITSEAAKGIITKPQTKHLCICLTPTRYLWSGYQEYFTNSMLRLLAQPLIWYLRKWDLIAAQRPDSYVAISKEVQKRIKTYYGRSSEVIYPPVTLPRVKREAVRGKEQGEGYFLVVSRLSKFTSYKRVDIAVKAATILKVPLLIVGDGDNTHLKKIAGPTVRFVGRVSDEELSALYAGCKALIFPGYEDFGLVMVEAQAHGKPVIAYKAGGAMEIVKEGKTGVLFGEQTTESLVEVLKSFKERAYNSQVCKENAARFEEKRFEEQIRTVIGEMYV